MKPFEYVKDKAVLPSPSSSAVIWPCTKHYHTSKNSNSFIFHILKGFHDRFTLTKVKGGKLNTPTVTHPVVLLQQVHQQQILPQLLLLALVTATRPSMTTQRFWRNLCFSTRLRGLGHSLPTTVSHGAETAPSAMLWLADTMMVSL